MTLPSMEQRGRHTMNFQWKNGIWPRALSRTHRTCCHPPRGEIDSSAWPKKGWWAQVPPGIIVIRSFTTLSPFMKKPSSSPVTSWNFWCLLLQFIQSFHPHPHSTRQSSYLLRPSHHHRQRSHEIKSPHCIFISTNAIFTWIVMSPASSPTCYATFSINQPHQPHPIINTWLFSEPITLQENNTVPYTCNWVVSD